VSVQHIFLIHKAKLQEVILTFNRNGSKQSTTFIKQKIKYSEEEEEEEEEEIKIYQMLVSN
jgi:hypothetical protein